jgi:hypothetical protein
MKKVGYSLTSWVTISILKQYPVPWSVYLFISGVNLIVVKVKGNGKVVPVLKLSITPWRLIGGRGIAPRILDLGIRWRWVVSFTLRLLYPQGKSPWYPVDTRLCGSQSRSGHSGEEKNFQSPPGIEPWNPDRPARNPALYRLSCHGSKYCSGTIKYLLHITKRVILHLNRLTKNYFWAPRHEGVLGIGSIVSCVLDIRTIWRWVVSFTPGPLYPKGRSPWYPLDRRLSGPQSLSGRGGEEKFPRPRLESNPRTLILQLVSQRYTDWVIT